MIAIEEFITIVKINVVHVVPMFVFSARCGMNAVQLPTAMFRLPAVVRIIFAISVASHLEPSSLIAVIADVFDIYLVVESVNGVRHRIADFVATTIRNAKIGENYDMTLLAWTWMMLYKTN